MPGCTHLSGGTANLLKKSVLTRDGLNGDTVTKAGTLLLNKVFDIPSILLNERCGNLN
jgi:hypothetical protein